jgi:hypothetical protein
MTAKNVVIRKNKKWYNTITKRYVSESYGKRINSYFKRNPKGVLIRASGHGKIEFKPRKKATKEELELVKRKTILTETKNLKGKTVYYSPKYNEIVNVSRKTIRSNDYINKMWKISLYRLTIDGNGMYHILRWEIKEGIENEMEVYEFLQIVRKFVIPVLSYELKKIIANHVEANLSSIYGKISSTLYSDIDYFPMASTFGFYRANIKSVNKFTNELIKEILKFTNKVKGFSYHSLNFDNCTIYILQPVGQVKNKGISKYREGVENIKF